MKHFTIIAAMWLICSSFTVHLMGDSTMAEKDLKGGTNPERGWGMMFQNFLDGGVKVINYAQNGRSTKSFIDLGLWGKVYDAIQPGDYVFIQFGHNDSKESDPERYSVIKEKNIDFSIHINRIEHEYLYADQLRLNQMI